VGIVENLSLPIRGIKRLRLDIEYIVPIEFWDETEALCEALRSAWDKDLISLVKFSYFKTSANKTQCVVYPVVLIHSVRAIYLVAYGSNPDNQEGWYNFRIDRIRKAREIAYSESLLEEQKQLYRSAGEKTPDYVFQELKKAYGFDFYQPAEDMLLRFDAVFYNDYVKGTDRARIFKPMLKKSLSASSYEFAKTFIKDKDVALSSRLAKCKSEDVYCLVKYRTKDNNVIMRLRAWGQKVEVLYPKELRKRMTDDIRETWESYNEEGNV